MEPTTIPDLCSPHMLSDGATMPSPAMRAMADGVTSLSDEERLALLLHGSRAGPVDVEEASRVLARLPLARMVGMRPRKLAKEGELRAQDALRLACALELGVKALTPVVQPRMVLKHASDVAALWAPRLAHLERERVVVLFLDGGKRLLGHAQVSDGWREGAPVDLRDVLGPALEERAHGIILLHNHPSGDPVPSVQDRVLTTRLRDAASIVGVVLLDHVIVARNGHTSLAAEGLCS